MKKIIIVVLAFGGYLALAVQGGHWIQTWLAQDYADFSPTINENGLTWDYYVPPLDFSWGWYILGCIFLFTAVISLSYLIKTVIVRCLMKQEQDK